MLSKSLRTESQILVVIKHKEAHGNANGSRRYSSEYLKRIDTNVQMIKKLSNY